jgi:hypothetical protein
MMRYVCYWILALIPLLARAETTTGSGLLTLAGSGSDNRLNITLSATVSGLTATDTQTTTASGTLDIDLTAHPSTGATSAFTIHTGVISFSNVRFRPKVFFGPFPVGDPLADITAAGMKGMAFTPLPPGEATPTANGGTFDAALHRLRIQEGTLSGTITATDPPTPIDADFADTPVEGAGSGTGTIVVTPGAAGPTTRTCQVVVTLPVDFNNTQDIDGIPVTVRVVGRIRAVGTLEMPLNRWVEWSLAQGITTPAFELPILEGGPPAGLVWAIGHDPDVPAASLAPVFHAAETPTAQIQFPETGSRAPILLEQSTDLSPGSWVPVPAAALNAGQNPLPPGTSGPVVVTWPESSERVFLRLAASPP